MWKTLFALYYRKETGGNFVWWRTLDKATLAKQLERVQRVALIDISGHYLHNDDTFCHSTYSTCGHSRQLHCCEGCCQTLGSRINNIKGPNEGHLLSLQKHP